MVRQLFIAALLTGAFQSVADPAEVPVFPFVDGLWSGETNAGENHSDFSQCRAYTTFDDNTILSLIVHRNQGWHLRLSNPGWQLHPSHTYDMVAQVDFYPILRVTAKVKNHHKLEIADIERSGLLKIIRNGHTIDLEANGFRQKYNLEGSAKIIERLSNCFAS